MKLKVTTRTPATLVPVPGQLYVVDIGGTWRTRVFLDGNIYTLNEDGMRSVGSYKDLQKIAESYTSIRSVVELHVVAE